MTTLRKLPTIAPAAKAKTLSRLNIESYAIPATRANVTTRALRNGGEWGLVASAVFKTVVSARKRRRVGSIPTRLRQRARPVALVGKAFFGSWDEGDYFAGGSVRNPIFIAPCSGAASIATTDCGGAPVTSTFGGTSRPTPLLPVC